MEPCAQADRHCFAPMGAEFNFNPERSCDFSETGTIAAQFAGSEPKHTACSSASFTPRYESRAAYAQYGKVSGFIVISSDDAGPSTPIRGVGRTFTSFHYWLAPDIWPCTALLLPVAHSAYSWTGSLRVSHPDAFRDMVAFYEPSHVAAASTTWVHVASRFAVCGLGICNCAAVLPMPLVRGLEGAQQKKVAELPLSSRPGRNGIVPDDYCLEV